MNGNVARTVVQRHVGVLVNTTERRASRLTTRCTARRSAASYAREVIVMIVNKVRAGVGRWAGGERERYAPIDPWCP